MSSIHAVYTKLIEGISVGKVNSTMAMMVQYKVQYNVKNNVQYDVSYDMQ